MPIVMPSRMSFSILLISLSGVFIGKGCTKPSTSANQGVWLASSVEPNCGVMSWLAESCLLLPAREKARRFTTALIISRFIHFRTEKIVFHLLLKIVTLWLWVLEFSRFRQTSKHL